MDLPQIVQCLLNSLLYIHWSHTLTHSHTNVHKHTDTHTNTYVHIYVHAGSQAHILYIHRPAILNL